MGRHGRGARSSGPDSPPPSYNSVTECSQLTLSRFRFPYEVCELLEFHGLTIQTCEDIHRALQLTPQDWLEAFVRAGVPADLAVELCDIFETDREGSEIELEEGSPSPSEVAHLNEVEIDNFRNLTLHN